MELFISVIKLKRGTVTLNVLDEIKLTVFSFLWLTLTDESTVILPSLSFFASHYT